MEAPEPPAQLTPDPELRARRLLEAADDRGRVGHVERAQILLAEALNLAADPCLRADVQQQRALIQTRNGAAAPAARLLVAEAERVAPVDPVRAAMMTMAAVQPSFQAGEWSSGLAIAQRGQRLVERAGLPPMPAGVPLAMALVLCNERRSARPLLAGAAAWLDQVADPWALGPVLLFGVGQAFMWLEEYERARQLLTSAIEQVRALSAPGLLPYRKLSIRSRTELVRVVLSLPPAPADAHSVVVHSERLPIADGGRRDAAPEG